MFLPLLLSFLATLAAAVMAYGTDPRWVEHSRGLNLIIATRRLQWPLVAVSLALCLALLGLVISGRRRVWWLIALAPVMALFVHRFLTAPSNRFAVLDEPGFVAAADAKHVRDDEHVVGIVFNDQPYAYPYAALWRAPVVVQSDREHRLLLVWNAGANAATPLAVSRELKARDLDVVCDPADSLFLYNSRSGQFIVGVTGRTTAATRPSNVESTLPATLTTWGQWRSAHPKTRVLNVIGNGPTTPISPRSQSPNAKLPVVVIAAGEAHLAIATDGISVAPLNVKVGDVPAVVFRDRVTGEVRAFDRRLEADLVPQFKLPRDAKQKEKGVVLIDGDTNSGWNAKGVAIDGAKDWRGKKLVPLDVREGIYFGPAQFWYRELPLYSEANLPQ